MGQITQLLTIQRLEYTRLDQAWQHIGGGHNHVIPRAPSHYLALHDVGAVERIHVHSGAGFLFKRLWGLRCEKPEPVIQIHPRLCSRH
ncbi:hypothetical protein D3C77_648920 [compost metagenome]